MIIAFYKPFGVLSQFTKEAEHHITLAEFNIPKQVYPLGRLDSDSEGLLLLSDEPGLNTRLLRPENEHPRTYYIQVEGIPTPEAFHKLMRGGINIKGHFTAPCKALLLSEAPTLPERTPPIRFRAQIPTSWMSLTLVEGKNRQVRRMTAAVGFPTLRLIRMSIGALTLASLNLQPGEWCELTLAESKMIFQSLTKS